MDELAFDPYVLAAAALYLGAAGGLGLLLTGARLAARGGAWAALEAALAQARQMGASTAVPLAGGEHGDFLVLARGKHAARVPARPGHAGDLAPVRRAALVKDMDGQTGLVVVHGADTSCVTGLEPMARAWGQLQADDVQVELVFRDDEGERLKRQLRLLHPKEQALVEQWLTPNEVLTDVIRGVDYEGTLQAPGSKGSATLLVTNLRVGLLAQTVLVERVGNATRTTTSLSLVNYLLPLATQVTLERAPSLGKPSWRLRLELPAELPDPKAPTLVLGPDHTGMFLPLVVFRRPVRVVDAGAGLGRVVLETIGPALGCGLLLGGLAAGVAALVYGQQHTYHGRYILPAALCGLATPAWFKALHLVEAWRERARQAGVTAGT